MERALVLALTALWIACARHAEPALGELPTYFPAPSFQGTTVDGTLLASTELHGKVYVVSFFFTSCTGPCPIMNSRLSVLHSLFADEPRVRFVSVTVDPRRDTPSVLKRYAERYGAKPGRWDFLWMSPDKLEQLTREFRVSGSPEHPDLHTTRFILVDGQGMVRGFFSGLEEEEAKKLERAIRYLLNTAS